MTIFANQNGQAPRRNFNESKYAWNGSLGYKIIHFSLERQAVAPATITRVVWKVLIHAIAQTLRTA